MAAALIPAAVAAVEFGVSEIQKGKEKKEARKLAQQRPTYNITPEARSEESLASSELSRGMGAEAEQAYNDDLERGYSTSIGAIEKYGGGVNNVAQVYDSSEQGRQRLSLMKEQLRVNNINNVVNSYRNMAEQRDKQFQINQYAPYTDEATANAQARQGSANLEASAFNSAISAAGQYASGQQMKNFFKTQSNNGGSPSFSMPSSQRQVGNGPDLSPSGSYSPTSPNLPQFNGLDVNGTSDDNFFSTQGITQGE